MKWSKLWRSVSSFLNRHDAAPKSVPEGKTLYQLEIQEVSPGAYQLHLLQVVAPYRTEGWDGNLTVTGGWFLPLSGDTRELALESARSVIDMARGSGDILYWKPGSPEEERYGRQ